MGMIVTLYLISTNVYNSVEAPYIRGFSYIELWMIGTQIPILLSLIEYGFVLYLKKIAENIVYDNQTIAGIHLEERIKKLDFVTMTISFLYFITFTLFYWIGNPMKYSS